MKKQSLLILLSLYSCSPTLRDKYSGYLYNGKLPLKKVRVLEQDTKNSTYTDDKGYFELKMSDVNKINNLIIENQAEKDTLKLLRGSGAGSKLNYIFLTNKSDTVDIQRERIFNKQSSNE